MKNAPAVFQGLMTKVLHSCIQFARPYMDDVVIFSHSWEEHIKHIREVLWVLKGAGLTVNPAKCHWGGQYIEFLGHKVGNGKMSIPLHRAKALKAYTKPRTKRGLRAFLGSASYYRRYIELVAKHTAILSPATSKAAPAKVDWSPEMETAFLKICESLSHTCMLTIPLPDDQMSIVSDASGGGIGGVVQVKRGETWEAAAFYSHQTRGAEHHYSATELEALALVETIRHFAYYLYGRPFQAFTDHKPLCQLLFSGKLNGRLKRLSLKLQHWLLDVVYVPGEDNGLADALSREERGREIPEEIQETDSEDGHMSGIGECEGTAST